MQVTGAKLNGEHKLVKTWCQQRALPSVSALTTRSKTLHVGRMKIMIVPQRNCEECVTHVMRAEGNAVALPIRLNKPEDTHVTAGLQVEMVQCMAHCVSFGNLPNFIP